jgi:polyisoprenoid-binding protein YceI
MPAPTVTTAGYRTGTWQVDPVHSEIGFSVRHLMLAKIRGRFTRFEATIVTAEDPLDSTVTATIDLTSIDTGNALRDGHLRAGDFLDTETHEAMTYRSTGVQPAGDGWTVDGELTLHGVTCPVPLTLELNGFGSDPWGGQRAGFTAATEINRRDFGVAFNVPMDGGVAVGDKVAIQLDIEAVLDQP